MVKFGAFNSPTPEGWKTAFKVVSVLTTVLAFWLAGTNLIPEGSKVEILVAFKSLDMLVFGIGRTFGVVPDEESKGES